MIVTPLDTVGAIVHSREEAEVQVEATGFKSAQPLMAKPGKQLAQWRFQQSWLVRLAGIIWLDKEEDGEEVAVAGEEPFR